MARRHKRSDEEVELNLAAMLDMAFQLLAFFIMTWRPAPVEGMIAMRLPPAKPVANVSGSQKAGEDTNIKPTDIKGVSTLAIAVYADKNGNIDTMGVNGQQVKDMGDLERTLAKKFSDPANPFDQVVIQADSNLYYGQLMRIVEACTHQKVGDKPLAKMSFLEVPHQRE